MYINKRLTGRDTCRWSLATVKREPYEIITMFEIKQSMLLSGGGTYVSDYSTPNITTLNITLAIDDQLLNGEEGMRKENSLIRIMSAMSMAETLFRSIKIRFNLSRVMYHLNSTGSLLSQSRKLMKYYNISDTILLIFSGSEGQAQHQIAVCPNKVWVTFVPNLIDPHALATQVAHEVGHIIGLHEDMQNTKGCDCKTKLGMCVMHGDVNTRSLQWNKCDLALMRQTDIRGILANTNVTGSCKDSNSGTTTTNQKSTDSSPASLIALRVIFFLVVVIFAAIVIFVAYHHKVHSRM
jgi:hypothetical protein